MPARTLARQDLAPDPRPMPIFFNAVFCLSAVLGCVSDELAAPSRPCPLSLSGGGQVAAICPTLPTSIRCPFDRPATPVPSLLSLDESDIEEQETNELSESDVNPQIGFTFDAALADFSLLRSWSDRLPLHTARIETFLRC
jgi:hypothetical protein